MGDGQARLRHEPADERRHRVNRLHAVVYEEDLTAPAKLQLDGRLDDALAELHDLCLNGEPVARRRLDDRHVPESHERHVQRARYRRRGEREHVHPLLQLLEPLLVRDAEALLLVNDDEAEVAEGDVFREQAVRADDDVNLARLDALDDLFLLFGRAEARDEFDGHGEDGEARAEGLVVLVGEHRGRREHRRLLRVHDGLEGRAHRHLGLAVAHVAAQKPVHRRDGFHVALHVLDGRVLVGSGDVLERVLELALPRAVRREGVPLDELPFRVELQKLVGHVAHRALGLRLRLVPAESAQAVEHRLVPLGARIALHQVEPLDGHVELRLVGVGEQHELAFAPAEFERLKAAEARDAVVYVDDVVADFQIPKVGEEGGGQRLAPTRRAGGGDARARHTLFDGRAAGLVEQVCLDVDEELCACQFEAAGEFPGGDDGRGVCGLRPALARERDARRDVVVGEHVRDALGHARRRHREERQHGALLARVAHVRGEVCDASVVALRRERRPLDFGRALDRGEKKERLRRVALPSDLCRGLLRLARESLVRHRRRAAQRAELDA